MTEEGDDVAKLRLSKWLWAARFYKTRSLAAAAIDAGHVHVDGERVTVRKGGLAWNVEVLGVAERRGSAADAAKLYVESDASRAAREEEAARRRAAAAATGDARFDGRPTQRDRRKLEDFLNEP